MKPPRPSVPASAEQPAFWRRAPEGVSVAVKVQPRARRAGVQDVVNGADGPRLRIAVSEPPEDGKASRAVCTVLADAIGVARGAVEVVAGASAREKRLLVRGDPDELARRLAVLGSG